METEKTQEDRLDYLVEAFKKDSGEYRTLRTPSNAEGKRQLLRALMNIRMPRAMAEETLRIQNEYLTERSREKGIVSPGQIPTIAESLGSKHKAADRISLWQGDITCLAADAIVNAANSRMLGCFQPCHGCIDNCIHTYAGIQLREECSRKMYEKRLRFGQNYEQPTTVPMLTDGYNLPARKVVHIVGPIVADRLTEKEERELAACYRGTLDLCRESGLRTVAFCSISTGVFRFPKERAAEIAIQTVTDWLTEYQGETDRVIFVVHNDRDREIYERNLR